MAEDTGYVNYFAILDLDENAKPGEVRKSYKRKMKDLVMEIARVTITEDLRAKYLLEMAKLNAALVVLRDTDLREQYWQDRQETISLEEKWREAAEAHTGDADSLRRRYERRLRHFLSRYVEEMMLAAGRDKDCVEASNWDEAHERHGLRIFRHYQHRLYRKIHERLPYHEVTIPAIDWGERCSAVATLVDACTGTAAGA